MAGNDARPELSHKKSKVTTFDECDSSTQLERPDKLSFPFRRSLIYNEFMTNAKDSDTFYAKSAEEWREWLANNGQTEKSIRLILFHKKSGVPSVGYQESIEHALCFGWIDSKANKRDDKSFFLFFTPRKPGSTWGKANRERAEKMIALGLMTPAGQAMIDLAKKSGAWDSLAEAQDDVIPTDLQALFDENQAAYRNFQSFAHSYRRAYLEWILDAKRPETRLKRMAHLIQLAERNQNTLPE